MLDQNMWTQKLNLRRKRMERRRMMVRQKMWVQNLNRQNEIEERRTGVTTDDMESGVVPPQHKYVKKQNHARSKDGLRR